jgi:hypothetical protein
MTTLYRDDGRPRHVLCRVPYAHRSWAVVVRHGGFRTGATSGSQGRTFWGHQNQRPRRAATDGVMSDRTIKVSNSIHVAFPR